MKKGIFALVLIITTTTIVSITCKSENHLAREGTLELIFGGDLEFGDSYHLHKNGGIDTCIFNDVGYSYSFEKINAFLKSEEIVIANLETPLYSKTANNKLTGKKRYLHWCKPKEAIATLKANNLNYLSLANNHTLDQGFKGLQGSFDNLKSAKIQYFGAGPEEQEASEPLILNQRLGNRNIYIIGGFQYNQTYDHQYHFYADKNIMGVNMLDEKKIINQIKIIKKKDNGAVIIIFPHWGDNYEWADSKQKNLGKAFLSAGADLIVGHGAHKFQEIDHIEGKWIFYNLGNLVMNSPGRFKTLHALPYSFIVKIHLESSASEVKVESKIYPILSDNKISRYQPNFISEREMFKIQEVLIQRSNLPEEKLSLRRDDFGFYFELK